MSAWKTLIVVSILFIISGGSVLLWEKRSFRTTPAANAARTDLANATSFHVGGTAPTPRAAPTEHIHEEMSASDVAEGKRLFSVFNCNTCHMHGGGAIGPALMDDKWRYGSEPRSVFATIVEGRPNGMPAFRGKIPDAQVWQLVAYVRSMSGLVPMPMRNGRSDGLSAKEPENRMPVEPSDPSKDPGANRVKTGP